MKKLKSNGDTLDRLSELHDSLIHEILSFLDMRYVVRTSLLSKRWKYLWTSVPCLVFTAGGRNSVQFRNFVNRALMLWRGTRIRIFVICYLRVDEAASLSTDIDLWVLYAKERNVEDICICLPIYGQLYCPPQCLYECSSLRKLDLFGCNLQIHGNVKWHRLSRLRLSGCSFPEGLVDKVLSSSPQVENFKLNYLGEGQNLSIRSSSLKRLWVRSCNDVSSVMTIWAPNLEKMTLHEKPYGKCLLTNVSSLTEVYLGFRDSSSAAAEEALFQFLPAIQHVVTVGLSADCLKMLVDGKGKHSFSPLLNVKLLKIDNVLTELSELVGVLEIFPKLKMLNIDWGINHVGEVFKLNAKDYTMAEANILKSNLLLLRKAKVTWYLYEPSMFEFIEFLLKHATMIEKMVIQKIELPPAFTNDSMLLLTAQKKLSLQRSFPNVELVFC